MIAIGSDHGGYELKTKIVEHLEKKGFEIKDFGTNSSQSVDYPDYAQKVAMSIVSGKSQRGILICGTGIGVSIAANKIPGIRSAVCTNVFMAKASRRHNNANILAIGQRVLGDGLAFDIVDAFLDYDFDSGRHKKRVDKIYYIEKNFYRGDLKDE